MILYPHNHPVYIIFTFRFIGRNSIGKSCLDTFLTAIVNCLKQTAG